MLRDARRDVATALRHARQMQTYVRQRQEMRSNDVNNERCQAARAAEYGKHVAKRYRSVMPMRSAVMQRAARSVERQKR